MDFQTKEQVLEKILAHEKPQCPHCNTEMSLWETPPLFIQRRPWMGSPLPVCMFQ